MKTITFRLPWPPSVNHYYGRSRSGRVYLAKPGRMFRKMAAGVFEQLGWPRVDGPVAVHLIYQPPDRRIRDIDNPRKAVYDAISDRYDLGGKLTHKGIIADDVNIRSDRADFTEPGEGFVEVIVTQITGGEYERYRERKRRASKRNNDS